MRKYISFLLVISLLASVIAFPVVGFADDKKLLASQSFNGIVTGLSPTGDTVATGNAKVVVTKEGKEKGLELSKAAADASLYMAATPGKKFVSLYSDIKYTGGWSKTDFYIQNAANKQYVIGTVATNGALTLANGKRVTTVPKDRDTSIQITYDMQNKRVSIYIGGKCVLNNRFLDTAAFTDVAGMGIKVAGEKGKSFIVDNFAIFEGKSLVKSSNIPKAAFLNESIEIAPEEESVSSTEGEYEGEDIYFVTSFEETEYEPFTLNSINTGLIRTPSSNSIEVVTDIFNENNKYAKLEKTVAAESYIALYGNPDAHYTVIEADLSTESNTPAGKILFSRDGRTDNYFNTFLTITADGVISTHNKITVGKIEPMKWLHLGVLIDLKQRNFDVYVNGELKAEDVPFQNKELIGFGLFRMGCDKYNNTGTLLFDNIKLYEGKTFRETPYSCRSNRMPKDGVAKGYIDMNKVVSPYSNTYYTDLTKYNSKHEIILEDFDETCYMHKEDLEVIFGKTVRLEGQNQTNPDYYNITLTSRASGYMETRMDTRLYMFSKSPINLTDAQLMEVLHYVFNERPDAEKILELFNTVNKNQRPRVLMNADDLARIKASYQTDPYMKEWYKNIIATADKMIGRSPYKYKLTGTSMADVTESLSEIGCICLAYILTGEEKYLTTTWDFLVNICNMKDFSPAGYLDYGELPYVLAVGYDWLYDYWTEEQRQYLAEKIYEKAIHFTYKMYHNEFKEESGKMYTTWWDGDSNFNAVINSGLIASAIAIMDTYPKICSEFIEMANKAMEYFTTSYYPDGAWHEGLGYWSYSSGYLMRGVKTMENAFGTSFGIMSAPGLNKTGWYATTLSGSTETFALGDGGGGGFVNNAAIAYMASYFNDKELMAVRFNEFDIYKLKGSYEDMIYYNPGLMDANTKVSLDTYMAGMEAIGMREAWYDTGATAVGFSGGKNTRVHGHMDIGSFQFDMAGERFITDIGAENYRAPGGYFGANRYRFYKSRPEGHNLYIINPEDNTDYYGQVSGASSKAVLAVSKDRGAISTIDLSAAYAPWATKAIRGVMLGDDRRSVTVRDEIDLIKPNSEVYWFAHTRGCDYEFINATTVVISKNGKKILATIDTNASEFEFKEMEAKTLAPSMETLVTNTVLSTSGVKKLAIVCKGTGRLNITVKFKQFDDEMIDAKPTNLNIADWTIPDGKVTPLPKLDSIYVNGKALEEFDGAVTGYSYMMPTTATAPYAVSVASDLKCEITQASAIGEDALVRVYSNEDASVYRTYRINFWQKEPLGDVDGMRRYPVAKMTSSQNATENNTPDCANDGDFATWWSANASETDPHWMMYELEDVFAIEKIGVAWYNGGNRVGKYKLEVSEDGVNWTTVFNGETLKNAADKPEYTQLGGRKAKFVKITGYGTTVNGYVMVGELQILGNQR